MILCAGCYNFSCPKKEDSFNTITSILSFSDSFIVKINLNKSFVSQTVHHKDVNAGYNKL